MVMSVKATVIDEDSAVCQLAAEEIGPASCLTQSPVADSEHLDGSNMDEGFEFSFHRTLEEWEEAERRCKEFDEEFNRKWAQHGGESMMSETSGTTSWNDDNV